MATEVPGDKERQSFSPFSIMRQGIDETERFFGATLRRDWEQFKRGWMSPHGGGFRAMDKQSGDWLPAIEVLQRKDQFVIRADVPGMNRQDLHVEVADDAVTIRGERREDHREERDGVFWTERSYGSFTRVVPLPPGAITESAKASFNNGVLEIVVQAPPAETRKGRRVDVSGSSDDGKK